MRLRRIVPTVLAVALAAATGRAETDRPWTIALLPVHVGGAGDPEMQRTVEAVLDAELTRLPGVVVVERARIQAILDELVLSRLNRKDLQAGQIVGAEVLLAARLTHEAERVDLALTAIETATGNILLSQSFAAADNPAIREAARRFMEALPASLVRREHVIDVAVLPITHTSPFPEQGGVAESLRGRLAERLATLPGVRVLHRELGEFVLAEASLAAAGLMDPERTFAPVAGAIAVHGNLTQTFPSGKEVDQSQLVLELKVSRGGEEKEIRVSGILAEAAAMETEAVQRLAEAIAALAGTPAPPAVETDDRTRRYWEAQKYLALARQIQASYAYDDPQREIAAELALKAANLIPDSPEPFVTAREEVNRWLRWKTDGGSKVRPEDDPIVILRRKFIELSPEHPLWPKAVMEEISYLLYFLSSPKTPIPKYQERALTLAHLQADTILQGRNSPGDDGQNIRLTICRLIEAGECEKALRLCEVSAPQLDRQPQLHRHGWSSFNTYVIRAIDLGLFDWAYKAAALQQTLYPGYEVTGLDEDGRIDKLRQAGQYDRWRPIIEGAARKAAQEKEASQRRESQLVLPPWGSTVLVDAVPLEGLVSHRVPKGRAMSISAEGGTPLAVLRNGQEYFLWRIGDSEPLALDGIAPLYPPGVTYTSYVMRPSIASFGGRVYVGAEQHGLYAVDPATGKTTRVTDGFPDGSVYALVVRDGALYAAGGGEKAGYIARLMEGRNQWTIWMAPKSCGWVRSLLPRDAEPWRVLHPECTGDRNRPDRLSRFHPASGQWEEGRIIEAHCFQPSLVSAAGRLVVLQQRGAGWTPLCILNEATGDSSPLYFPPADLSSGGKHKWFWNRKIYETMHVAPLKGPPTDAFSDGDALWLLDSSGCLSATRDGDSFLGPLKVAPSGHSLALTTDTLFVSNQDTVVLVPMETLRGLVREPGAFRSSEEIRTEVRRRLEAWLDRQPPLQQFAYLQEFANLRIANLGTDRDLCGRVLDACRRAAAEPDARTSIEKAVWLCEALGELGARDEAVRVFMPFAEDPGKLDRPSAECTMLYYMQQAGKWKELAELVPRLWKESPLRNVTLYHVAPRRVEAYLRALYYTNQKEAFEKAAWAYVRGDWPELAQLDANWQEKPYLKDLAKYVRNKAAGILRWYLEKEGRADEIRSNPLLAEDGD